MDVLYSGSPGDFDRRAADCMQRVLAARPDAAIALPTGRTPLGLYAELRRRHTHGALNAGQAHFFQLDEYVGLASDNPRSFASSLQTGLLSQLACKPGHVHWMRADAPDPAAECNRYEEQIAACGGIDLAILGVGSNGHIAFNEPGTSWTSRTHLTVLAEETRAAMRAGAVPTGRSALPTHGITMGVGTILDAREILLLVSGSSKRAALDALLRAIADPRWPVTALLSHPHCTTILSEEFDVAENP